MDVKRKIKGKRFSLKTKRRSYHRKNRYTSLLKRIFFRAKFACHGSLQDAGEYAATQNPRRYPGYYL